MAYDSEDTASELSESDDGGPSNIFRKNSMSSVPEEGIPMYNSLPSPLPSLSFCSNLFYNSEYETH